MSATGTEISCASVWPSARSASDIEVAQFPESLGLRFVGCQHRIDDEALLKGRAKELLEFAGDVGLADPRSSLR